MKYSKLCFVLLFLLCLATNAVGQWLQPQPSKRRAVYRADYYVSPTEYDYSAIARDIIGNASSRYDKAQRIYLWLCSNISFDRTGKIRTADDTWRRRRAVCQGYCELFYRLGETVGLKTRLVYGKCRRPSADGTASSLEEHVWLSVATEQGDILLDPTWGAGFYRGNEFIRQQFPLRWFDVDPAWFIFTHLPKNEQRQHLSPVITEEQFSHLHFIAPPAFPNVAEDAHEALLRALGSGEDLVVQDSVLPVLNDTTSH